jgi:uncharacterized protein (TIGR03000 family)
MLFLVFPAHAQVLSKWGHPVITLGWTPYDWDDTGLGNYHGGPGHIQAYGYYQGNVPGQVYPWMDGPGTPFDRRKLAPHLPPPAADEAAPPADAALIIVQLPAESVLWFDETKTNQEGNYRRFVTPALPAGKELTYTLRVRWGVKDADLSRVEKVRVEPGKRVVVNFLTVDGWTGTRVETVPQPRKQP